jgi:hypothetical protein
VSRRDGPRDGKRDRERERELVDDRSHLEALKDDLEIAQRAIKRIDGDQTDKVTGRAMLRSASADNSPAATWLGAPTLLRLTRRFDGRLERTEFEQLVERIRETTHDPGVVELNEGSLLWSSTPQYQPTQAHMMVRVTLEKDSTELGVTDRLGALVGRLFGAFGSIFAAGGIAVPVAASLAFPALAPVFVAGWVGGVFGTTRVLYRKLVTARAERLHEVFGALVLAIQPHLEHADGK